MKTEVTKEDRLHRKMLHENADEVLYTSWTVMSFNLRSTWELQMKHAMKYVGWVWVNVSAYKVPHAIHMQSVGKALNKFL